MIQYNRLYGAPIKHVDQTCWYKKGTNNKRTYDHTNHLMELHSDTIITLASMTYIANLDAYLSRSSTKSLNP
jgi:hypothetical protein